MQAQIAGRRHRNIQRVDHHYFHGWMVSVERRGQRLVEYVRDGAHGGREGALRAALTRRDAVEAKLPPPVKVKSTFSLNTTGEIGGGTPTLAREYDPWGNLLQGSATSGFAYTGREWDAEAGLHYYRARYYNSQVGRFLSEDPLNHVGGSNFYAYAVNNPLRFVDPTGLIAPFRIEDCSSLEDQECEVECYRRGSPGVKSCFVVIVQEASVSVDPGGAEPWELLRPEVRGKPNCTCKDMPNPVCNDTCITVVTLISILGLIAFVCITKKPPPPTVLAPAF